MANEQSSSGWIALLVVVGLVVGGILVAPHLLRSVDESGKLVEKRGREAEERKAAEEKKRAEERLDQERRNKLDALVSQARQNEKTDVDLALGYLSRAEDFLPKGESASDKAALAEFYFLRGQLYFAKKDWSASYLAYSKVIAQGPDASIAGTAYANRGTVSLNSSGDYEKAIADYSNAIRIGASTDYAYALRGYCYYKQSRYKESISDCTRAIELNPRNAKAYHTRGDAYWYVGTRAQYLADRNKASDLDPSFPRA